MKEGLHPEYHPVVFVDSAADFELVTRSTKTSGETRQIDGVEHYVIRVEISSASHPFFTGEQRFVDTAGRVEKFQRKYQQFYQAQDDAKQQIEKVAAKNAKKATPAPASDDAVAAAEAEPEASAAEGDVAATEAATEVDAATEDAATEDAAAEDAAAEDAATEDAAGEDAAAEDAAVAADGTEADDDPEAES